MVQHEAVRMYEGGMSVRKIASALGMSATSTIRLLHACGAKMRNKTDNQITALSDGEWLRKRYESGASTTDIAVEVGCGTKTVSVWLAKHGIQARSRGSQKGHSRNTAEVRQKMSEAKRDILGENNPNWKGGHSPNPDRNRYAAKKWVKTVKERDGWTCVQCGAKDKLHAHHIKPWKLHPELRYDVDNGTTLCEPCHQAAHGFVFPWNRHAETSTSAQPR